MVPEFSLQNSYKKSQALWHTPVIHYWRHRDREISGAEFQPMRDPVLRNKMDSILRNCTQRWLPASTQKHTCKETRTHSNAIVHTARPEGKSWKSILSFHHVGLIQWTQMIRLGSKCLIHWAIPCTIYKKHSKWIIRNSKLELLMGTTYARANW